MELFCYAFEVEMEKLMTSPGRALSRTGKGQDRVPTNPTMGMQGRDLTLKVTNTSPTSNTMLYYSLDPRVTHDILDLGNWGA